MTHTKKILFSLLALAACGSVLQAQEAEPRHELSVSLQGLGFGSTPFRGNDSWNDQPGLSLGFNVGYTYWLGEHVGLRTGLRLARLSHNQEIKNLDMPFTTMLPLSSIGLPGGSVTTVNMRAAASAVQEEHNYTFIELPLQVALRFNQVYLNLGLSLSKAVYATGYYSYSDPSCAITALPDLGVTMATPVNRPLNGEKEGRVKNGDMTKPFYCLLDAEVGYNFPINDVTSIGVGLFGRYAPIAHKVNSTTPAFDVQADASYYLTQPSTSTLVDKMGYYEVGLSIGVNFGLRKRQAVADEDEPELMPVDECAEQVDAERAAREAAEKRLASERMARQKAEAELETMKAAYEKALADQQAAYSDAARANADAARANADAARANADAARAQAEAARTKAEAERQLEAINATVYFDNAGTKLKFDDKTDAAIHAICDAMKADANLKVSITGHTDNTGSSKTNFKYGKKRAEALKKYMVNLGAPAKNIECKSKGETDPIADNGTSKGRALNRRATVMFK